MFKKMFENIGKKIMGVVKLYFYTNVVVVTLAVLIATVWMASEEDIETGLLVLLIGAIAGLIYLLLVYIGMLCAYGFGELVQCNIEQRNMLRTLVGRDAEVGPKVVTEEYRIPKKETEATHIPPEYNPPKKTTPVSAPVMTPVSTGTEVRKVVCPHCGARQPEGMTHCKYCKTPIDWEKQKPCFYNT